MEQRTHSRFVHISVRVEMKRVVKVKAYKRLRRGKVEKVRSYYGFLAGLLPTSSSK